MPTLIDCGKKTPPPLNAGDKLVHVNMSTSNSGPELTYVSSKDKVSGISTTGLTYCTAVTLVERGSNGTIQKLAMTHVNGGIDASTLDRIVAKAGRDSFIISDIVVQYGIHENQGNKERVEKWLSSQKGYACYSRENDTSSCITFSGHVGSFSYLHNEAGPFVINAEALFKDMAANNPQAKGSYDIIMKINSYSCEPSVKNKMYECALAFYQAVVLKEIPDFEKTKALAHLQSELNKLSTSTREEKNKPPLSENHEDLSDTDDEDEIGFDGPSGSVDGPSEQQQEQSIACKMRAEMTGMRASASEPSSEDEEEEEEEEEAIAFANPFEH